MTFNVVLFLSSPSLHLALCIFKQSNAKSSTSFVRFLIFCSNCSMADVRTLRQSIVQYGLIEKRTIWSTLKSGSASHAPTNSDITSAKSGVNSHSVRLSYLKQYGKMMVSSVSLGHAAANPEFRSNQLSSSPVTLQTGESLTGWIRPPDQGDRQSLDF